MNVERAQADWKPAAGISVSGGSPMDAMGRERRTVPADIFLQLADAAVLSG